MCCVNLTLLLLEMRTVLVWRLQEVQNLRIWSCLFTSSCICTMESAFSIGYTHLYRTWNTLWNVEWSSRILEVASCFLLKITSRNIQNVSKEHSDLQGVIFKWNYSEWQISDRLKKIIYKCAETFTEGKTWDMLCVCEPHWLKDGVIPHTKKLMPKGFFFFQETLKLIDCWYMKIRNGFM